MESIPLIDLSNEASLAGNVESALRDVGFMYVVEHAIPRQAVTNLRACLVRYFALPVATKRKDNIERDNYRGYIPEGFFTANDGRAEADRYEGYKLHYEVSSDDPIRDYCDLYGPNKWPTALPELQPAVLRYWSECDRVTSILLAAIAEVLAIERQVLLSCFEQPLTNMTLLHYRPQSPGSAGFGIHPHKDTDALTILSPDPVGGLMVQRRDRSGWIPAEPPDDALIVNVGDLLELWSGGYFVSTPHKVENKSGAKRYSFPYFAVPRFDTVVEPLVDRQPGFAREAVHVGDVSREVWRTNWPDTVPEKPHYDLGTLENK